MDQSELFELSAELSNEDESIKFDENVSSLELSSLDIDVKLKLFFFLIFHDIKFFSLKELKILRIERFRKS
jgi:hypothetical protein